jgi:hypothetical protein
MLFHGPRSSQILCHPENNADLISKKRDNYVEFAINQTPVSQAFLISTPHNYQLHIRSLMWNST